MDTRYDRDFDIYVPECNARPDSEEGGTLPNKIEGIGCPPRHYETEFRITNVQAHRIVITETKSGDTEPLQRDQFAALADLISDTGDTFQLQRLPPDAEPYVAVLSLHPRYECDKRAETLTETDEPTTSQLITEATPSSDDDRDRSEPDLDVYADILLLIDTLEHHDPAAFGEWETPVLINLYTLLSGAQRNAGDLRTGVREISLDRLQHDQPVHGQYGSVQRTTRRNRSLKDDNEVHRVLKDEGTPHDPVMAVNREKVYEALDVTELSESAVYDIDEREYVRKADVDEETKQSRPQGLKDQLALSDEPKAEDLREEVDELEQRIEELTEFSPGTEIGTS